MAAVMASVTDAQIDSMEPSKLPDVTKALAEENDALKKFIAAEDAKAVHKATSGLGTDESRLVEVLCNRTKAQLDLLSAASVAQYGKTLRQVVSGDVSGGFGKMMVYALQDVDDYGAQVFTNATKGVGTDEGALVDLVNTRTNAELAAIKAKYDSQNNATLVDTLNKEFGVFSKDIKKLLVLQFSGGKSESTTVDAAEAAAQAKALYKAGAGRMGTDEATFIDILGRQSRAQIQAIKDAYERAQGSSLRHAIEKETSGALETALVALLFPSAAAYTANAIHAALDGAGADSDRLCRILGGTDKRLMPAVCEAYLDTYGATVQETLRKEALMGGDFKAAAIAWCNGRDPTKGLEYKGRPTEPVALAKHLVAERENIRAYIAENDAILIHRACKGLGTDDGALVGVLCARTKEHLARVDRAYHALYQRSLVDVIRGETSGNYEDLLCALVRPYDEFDAETVRKACDGLGTNEQMLIEVLAPRSNARVRALKAKYDAKHDKPLIDRLNSELSGDFRRVIVELLKAERDESAQADPARAAQQAQALYSAGVGAWGTDEGVFMNTFTKSSRAQIEAIKDAYERAYGHSLRNAIERETSGDLEDALVALLYAPTEFFARVLNRAFKGLGTDEAAVVRVLGGHDKCELLDIADAYLSTYGVTLTEALDSELSGDFRAAARAWVATPDPLDLSPLRVALSRPPPRPRAPAVTQLSDARTVSLCAGDVGVCSKDMTEALAVGLGWDTRGRAIDLDAGVVMLSARGETEGVVFYGNKAAPGVAYGGDNRTGEGKGDDESVVVRLGDVPYEVDALVFTVHCYSADATFADVGNAYARLFLPRTQHVCANYRLGAQIKERGVAFAMLKRSPMGWMYCALGRGIPGAYASDPAAVHAVRALVSDAAAAMKDTTERAAGAAAAAAAGSAHIGGVAYGGYPVGA